MTRIVFILPDLPLSGAATRTTHLADYLLGEGFDVTVASFLPTPDPALVDRLGRSGAECLRLTTPWGLHRMRDLLRSQGDVVLHSAMPTAGLLGLVAAHLFHLPLVHSFTNALHTHRPLPPRGVSNHVKGRLESVLARRAAALHAVSRNVADQLLQSCPESLERLQCLTYHVTHPGGAGADSANGVIEATKDAWPKILCVGRLESHKRFDDAIRAIDALSAEYPDIGLVVLGTGSQQGRLQTLADVTGVGRRVWFVGTSGTPCEFYRWADVLLHPSVYEGYPRVFAEAIAEKLPVVTIDAPYARDSPTDDARILRARPVDAVSLANKVVEALELWPVISRSHEHDVVNLRELRELYLILITQHRSP